MVTLFKPNKKNTGAALFLSALNARTKDGVVLPRVSGNVMFKIVKQEGWNDKTHNGYFKGNMKRKDASVMVSLGLNEIAEVLQCFREKRCIGNKKIDYSNKDSISKSSSEKYANFFHRGDDGDKSFRLYPRYEGCSDGSFVLAISDITNKVSVGMALTSSESRLIEEALISLLNKYYSTEIDSSISYFSKNQGNNKSKDDSSKKSPKEEPTDEDEFADTDDGTGSELEDDEEDMPF
jgi:hypothetical protein